MKTKKWQNKDKGNKDEKAKGAEKHSRPAEDDPHTGRKKKTVHGKHSGAGKRVMASLLEQPPNELKITPEFICKLHSEAFGELLPYASRLSKLAAANRGLEKKIWERKATMNYNDIHISERQRTRDWDYREPEILKKAKEA